MNRRTFLFSAGAAAACIPVATIADGSLGFVPRQWSSDAFYGSMKEAFGARLASIEDRKLFWKNPSRYRDFLPRFMLLEFAPPTRFNMPEAIGPRMIERQFVFDDDTPSVDLKFEFPESPVVGEVKAVAAVFEDGGHNWYEFKDLERFVLTSCCSLSFTYRVAP